MISMIAASVLLCSGQTNSFDVQLDVNLQNLTVEGQMSDSEGQYPGVSVELSDLQESGRCLQSADATLCFNDSMTEANFEIFVHNEEATHFEKGKLDCVPK